MVSCLIIVKDRINTANKVKIVATMKEIVPKMQVHAHFLNFAAHSPHSPTNIATPPIAKDPIAIYIEIFLNYS